MSVLRRLMALLLRGPEGQWILDDLEELMVRDRRRGLSLGRSLWRYARNGVGSAISLWRHRERGTRGTLVSWLDVKLGVRMLAKHPGLAAIGVLGMAVAIAIGASSFAVIYTILDPKLPLDDGDRIVTIQNIDVSRNDQARGTHLHDLEAWRGLRALDAVGAYRTVDRNLVTPGARIESVHTAEMSASGFRIAGVAPLLGRYILEADESPGAGAVVVIGYDVWQTRFGGDPRIIGQTLQLGGERHVVIGVMPRGFAFPVNDRIWTPLRLDPADHALWEAPSIDVFGRLAPGASRAEAEAQVTTLAAQLRAEHPDAREHVRTRVLPYAHAYLDAPTLSWAFHLVQLLVSMLLVVIGTNVAVLVYARTATRTSEIAVRTALGASRGRVLGQLFIEALVLSGLAAAAGLAGAHFALREVNAFLATIAGAEELPFWWHFSLTPGVLVYVAGLSIVAAFLVGVLPGLKASTRAVLAGLLHSGPGGGGMRLGRTWTILIVAQVAAAVAILPVALHMGSAWLEYRDADPGFASGEYVAATVYLDREAAGTAATEEDAAFMQRYATLRSELVRRLESDPRVADVVVTTGVPGAEPGRPVEIEGAALEGPDGEAAAEAGSRGAAVAPVPIDFFDAFGVPLLTGRSFRPGDARDGASAVIVNTAFVDRLLGGGPALGRRIRYMPDPRDPAAAEEPWYEIVGVVPGFPFPGATSLAAARVYHATDPDDLYPATLAVRVRGEAPAAFEHRLREIGLDVDPLLRLGQVAPMTATMRTRLAPFRLGALLLVIVTLSTVLLSAAGIYALMAFTVARRRREIGIRSALGAQPHRVLTGVLYRALRQLAVGIAVGLVAAALMDRVTGGEMLRDRAFWILPAVALLMTVVGGIAAVGPARKGLRIQPTEALKAD